MARRLLNMEVIGSFLAGRMGLSVMVMSAALVWVYWRRMGVEQQEEKMQA